MSLLNEFEPAELDCQAIRTGSAWEWEIDLELVDDATGDVEPIDLTGADALLQLRRKPGDATALVSLSQINGIVLLGNTLAVSLPSAITATLNACALHWDLKLKLPGGDWWTPAKGVVAVEIGVSR